MRQRSLRFVPVALSVCVSVAFTPTRLHASNGLPELTALGYQPLSVSSIQAPAAPATVAPVAPGLPIATEGNDLAPIRLPESSAISDDFGGSDSAASCEEGPVCPMPKSSPWSVSVAGLVMTRNTPNSVWTTYETNNNPNQLMTPPNVDWNGGGELRFGRWFCCHQWGIEARYWTLDPLTASHSTMHVNSVSTPLIFSDLEFAGDTVEAFFDGAAEHRLSRTDEMHNLELNLLSGDLLLGSGYWSLNGLVGVRYFRFRENLVFGSLDLGGTWGGNGGVDEAYLNDRIRNDLMGVQVGGSVARRCWQDWRLFVSPQVGIYNNHIRHRMELYRGDGMTATPTVASGVPGSFPVSSSTDAVSFLTQVDIGLDWQISPCWSAAIGYRVVAITGVGLADNQIPLYLVDLPEIESIDDNGELVMHGAFVGVACRF